MYQVYRQIDGSGEMAFLGTSGTKSFTDTTLPAGSRAVVYQIRAMRSTAIGPSAQFIVNFGMSGVQATVKKAA